MNPVHGGEVPEYDECIGTADSVLLLFSPVIWNIKRSPVFPVTLLQWMLVYAAGKLQPPKEFPTEGPDYGGSDSP